MQGTGFTASRGHFKATVLKTVLIANRGEIALRLLRCCKALSVDTVVVYTAEDAGAPHAGLGTNAVLLQGKESEGKGYLDKQAIIEAAKKFKAQVILPGYGFLSENDEFCKMVEDAGLIFAGPRSKTIEELGLKHRCRQLAKEANVPCVPGTDLLKDVKQAIEAAKHIGYPVMLKSSSGGGGLGLQVCGNELELSKAFDMVAARSKSLFGNASCFLEKYIERGHHVEVQIFGNGLGDVIHFGERECSIQRRHQKVIEEAPSAFVEARPGFREQITKCAQKFASKAKYKSAGTLEFLVDDDTANFYFLECNTRLQVEHCVSEMVWDIDLVALMLQQAQYEIAGQGGIPSESLLSLQSSKPNGWAIEARCYCENPVRNHAPSPGSLQMVDWSMTENDRVDGWASTGTNITPSYDPLLAKIISKGSNRQEAICNLTRLLRKSIVYGPTNKDFLAVILESQQFIKGPTLTSFLTDSGFQYHPIALEVLDGGVSTSIQDLPARNSCGHGIPVAGPMDHLHFRLANVIVGNEETTEALEVTLKGPTIKFHAPSLICLAGAEMDFQIDDKPVEMFSAIAVKANSIVKIGLAKKGGCRAYLSILGGFPTVPSYLDSKSTTSLIALGGHQGRNLNTGDILEIQSFSSSSSSSKTLFRLPESLRFNHLEEEIPLYCMRGPFDDEEYITKEGVNMLYSKPMKVGHNIARTGLRLECDLLSWARSTGGEGGSHPSNILEIGYSLGGLNWNGSTPVILGPDGPDLGGLLISTTLVSAEWRAGQLTPGKNVRWVPISFAQARILSQLQDTFLQDVALAQKGKKSINFIKPLRMEVDGLTSYEHAPGSILKIIPADEKRAKITIRAAGDRNMLLEIGDMTADIVNRCRLELVLRKVNELNKPGILYCDPNIRSLTMRFDPNVISQAEVLSLFVQVESEVPDASKTKIPSREWNLPVCLDHPDVGKSVDRYRDMTRNKAIWLDDTPGSDNKKYLARANGLSSVKEVDEAILGTKMLTVANGFWLSTPILLAILGTKRLRCMKYNPTRLQTPEGALGLGGSMAAIYGCESAGGYQLVGRTLPGWSMYSNIPGFESNRPWLFEPFDILSFYQVDVDTYDAMLAKFKAGRWQWDVKKIEYNVASQVEAEKSNEKGVIEFKKRQAKALEEVEREEEELFKQWTEENNEKAKGKNSGKNTGDWDWETDPKAITVKAELSGVVWKALAESGKTYKKGETVTILEAMKMEIPCSAPCDFVAKAILKQPGDRVDAGSVVVAGLPLP